MIFVTTGSQLPFDRLVAAVDEIAPALQERVFAQIGNSSHPPRNVDWAANLDPVDFDERFRSASRIVSHAGIGTILRAQRFGKPIIVFPRQVLHGEHRNDHQLATCAHLDGQPGIYVARDKSDLRDLLCRPDLQAASETNSTSNRASLIANLRDYLKTI